MQRVISNCIEIRIAKGAKWDAAREEYREDTILGRKWHSASSVTCALATRSGPPGLRPRYSLIHLLVILRRACKRLIHQ
jgi:hypothetical protein